MDALSLGVFNVVSCRYSWIFCRKSKRTHGGASAGNSVYAIDDRRSKIGYNRINREYQVRSEYRTKANNIFDCEIFHQMMMSKEIVRPVGNPSLFTTDKTLINEFIMEVQYLEKVNQKQEGRGQELVKQARKLINEIKKQYSLQ